MTLSQAQHSLNGCPVGSAWRQPREAFTKSVNGGQGGVPGQRTPTSSLVFISDSHPVKIRLWDDCGSCTNVRKRKGSDCVGHSCSGLGREGFLAESLVSTSPAALDEKWVFYIN